MFPSVSAAYVDGNSSRFYNYGFSKIESRTESTPSTRYQLGSLGKVLTAIAVLQQVEQGNLSLQEDVNRYLGAELIRSYSDTSPVTLHCLLTHSCGINDLNIGYFARTVEELIPLAEFIRGSYPGNYQDPGVDISYSNYSYALAGYLVERAAKRPFQEYIQEHILMPLEMKQTFLGFERNYQNKDSFANAYRPAGSGYEVVEIFPRHAIPAGSLVSTSEDMARLLTALLKRDSILLNRETWEKLFTVQFTNHPLLNGYSYGLEQQNINQVESWAKGGMLQGMISSLLIVPDQFAFFSVTNTSQDNFGEHFFKELFNQLYGDDSRAPVAKDASNINELTGSYRDKRYNRGAVESIISLFRGAFRIYPSEDGNALAAYHNGSFHAYEPVEPFIFQNTELSNELLVFRRTESGQTVLFRNLNIGGLSVPTSYEKTSWYNSQDFVNEIYPVVPLVVLSGWLFVLLSLVVWVLRKRWTRLVGWKSFSGRLFLSTFLVTAALSLQMYLGPMYLFQNANEFLFGIPLKFEISKVVGYLMVPLTVYFAAVVFRSWKSKEVSRLVNSWLSLIGICLLTHIGFLFYWNFI
jgi:CubicO group peptidase (beta-lactamase class C family)